MEGLIAKVEMAQELYKELSTMYEMEFRGYYSPAMKDIYKKNPEWVEATKTIQETFEYRNGIESDMRVELMMNELGERC